jgi:hypothetical protein
VGAPPTGDPRVHLQPVTRHGMTLLPLLSRPATRLQADPPAGPPDPGA